MWNDSICFFIQKQLELLCFWPSNCSTYTLFTMPLIVPVNFAMGSKYQVVGLSKVVFSWRTFYSATLCILLILWTICVSLSRSLTNTSLWKQADEALGDMSLSNADRNIYLTLTVKTILRSWYFLLLWISQSS